MPIPLPICEMSEINAAIAGQQCRPDLPPCHTDTSAAEWKHKWRLFENFSKHCKPEVSQEVPGSYLYGRGRSMNYRRWLTGLQAGKPEEVSTPRAGPSCFGLWLGQARDNHKRAAGPSEDPGHGAKRPDPFSVQRMKRCRWTLLTMTEKQCARLS